MPQTRSLCASRVSERLILRRWVFPTCTMPRKYNMPCEFKHTGADIAPFEYFAALSNLIEANCLLNFLQIYS